MCKELTKNGTVVKFVGENLKIVIKSFRCAHKFRILMWKLFKIGVNFLRPPPPCMLTLYFEPHNHTAHDIALQNGDFFAVSFWILILPVSLRQPFCLCGGPVMPATNYIKQNISFRMRYKRNCENLQKHEKSEYLTEPDFLTSCKWQTRCKRELSHDALRNRQLNSRFIRQYKNTRKKINN